MARPRSTTPPLVAADVTIDPASINAVSTLDQTATVKGLRLHIPVQVWAESLEAGLVICNAHCSAKDTLKFRLLNITASAVDAASQTFRVVQR